MYNSLMPNNLKKKSYTLFSLHLPILIAVFAVVAGGFYIVTNTFTKEMPQVQGTRTEKGTRSLLSLLTKKDKSSESAGVEATVTPSTTAREHKRAVENVVREIKTVARIEEARGNKEVSEELVTIAEEQIESVGETVEAIDEVENEPKWKTILLGGDYKNLGELRSTIAKNTNTIRKLTNTAEKITAEGGDATIQDSLLQLNAERAKIIAFIKASESQFSILGWASKLLAGYTSTLLDEDNGDETEGTGSSAPVGGTEGIGDTAPSSTDTTGTGNTEPGSGETETPESAPGDQITTE